MTPTRQHRKGPPFTPFWSIDRSLTVLLFSLIVAVFVLYPLSDLPLIEVLLTVFSSLILISGVATIAKRRGDALVAGGIAVIALGLRWANMLFPSNQLQEWDSGGRLLAMGILAVVVLRQAYRQGPITVQRIQGAIAAYILIGLMFSSAYELFFALRPAAFNFSVRPADESIRALSAQLVYFSFVTLTTVGYGDVTPVNPMLRSIVTLEALIGQLFPAITLARLVSLEVYYRQQRGRTPARDANNLEESDR